MRRGLAYELRSVPNSLPISILLSRRDQLGDPHGPRIRSATSPLAFNDNAASVLWALSSVLGAWARRTHDEGPRGTSSTSPPSCRTQRAVVSDLVPASGGRRTLFAVGWPAILEWLRTVPDWGNVPGWSAFFAATFAGFLTYRGVRAANGQLQLATASRAEEVQEARQQQASQVAVWLTADGFGEHVIVVGCNGSGTPVYDLTIWWRDNERTERLIYIPVHGPTAGPQELRRASAAFNQHADELPQMLLVLREQGLFGLACQFRDSSNVWWYRNFDGVLYEGMNPAGPSQRETHGATASGTGDETGQAMS